MSPCWAGRIKWRVGVYADIGFITLDSLPMAGTLIFTTPEAFSGYSYFLYIVLELVAVACRPALYPCPIVVDGVDRVMQELGYLRAVVNAEAYQREYAYVGVKA